MPAVTGNWTRLAVFPACVLISSLSATRDSEPTAAPLKIESVVSKLLPTVSKPIQYVGGELNSTHKEWESPTGEPMVR